AGGSSDGTITVWDAFSPGAPSFGPFGGGSAVLTVAFGRDGRLVLAGAGDGFVNTYDLKGERVAAPFTAAADGVAALALSPDARYAAVAGSELGERYLRVSDTVTSEG